MQLVATVLHSRDAEPFCHRRRFCWRVLGEIVFLLGTHLSGPTWCVTCRCQVTEFALLRFQGEEPVWAAWALRGGFRGTACAVREEASDNCLRYECW